MGDTDLITEKRFASSYQSFWNGLIPMATRYVRRRNLQLDRFETPLESELAENRGVINELAYRLYSEGLAQGKRVRDLGQDVVERATVAALDFIQRFREYSRAPVEWPSASAIVEARSLAIRMELFVSAMTPRNIEVAPVFTGCGWLDECAGDLLLDDVLCELKAGGNRFRSRDLRQVLIYAALNSQSRQYSVRAVCLVNPRLGVFLQEELERLCYEVAGASASEVLGEIVDFVSQPQWRDEAV